VTDPAGNVVSMSYDLRGHMVAKQDPDVGTSSSVYDVLGELLQSTDNKGQLVTATYDLLGRPLSRTEPDLTSSWTYDTAAYGIGKLASAATNQGYTLSLVYDAVGRPVQSNQMVGGGIKPFNIGYDASSRIISIEYPTSFTVSRSYNAYGYVSGEAESDSTASGPLSTVNKVDAEGHLTQGTSGNGIATVRSYNPLNGELQSIAAGPGSSVQSLGYSYDAIGNILGRTDTTQSLTESFGYDALNRLTSATLGSNTPTTYGYDAIGNLKTKSDVGSFTYGPSGGAGPHQVQSVDVSSASPYAAAFAAGTERSYSWTSFNMPATVTEGGKTISFTYDGSHNRISQTAPEGTTYYMRDPITGALQERIDAPSVVTRRHYFAGGVSIWTYVGSNAPVPTIRYIHGDHLGSTAVLTDPTGAVVERDGYDAWGKRRYAGGATDATGAITSQTDQGYIAQEELPDVSLVHLNARLYDPLTGRFISADPIGLTGGANVYAYAGNNPIGLSDPSGLEPGTPYTQGYSDIPDAVGDRETTDDPHPEAGAPDYRSTPTGSHIPGSAVTGSLSCSGTCGPANSNTDNSTSSGDGGRSVATAIITAYAAASGANATTSQVAAVGDVAVPGVGSGSANNGGLGGNGQYVDTCGCGVYTPATGNGQTVTDTLGVGPDGNPLETVVVTASKPSPSDVTLLARMIFTEAAGFYDTPNLYNAIGFVAVNRVGATGYPKTLSGVINQPNQFQGIGGPLFQASANPSSLTGGNGVAFALALSSATNILNGSVPDPTGGAISFYSGPSPGGLSRQINSGQLVVTYSNFPFTFLGNGPR